MDYNVLDVTMHASLKWKAFKGFDINFMAATNIQMTKTEHNITDFANQAMAYRAMPDAQVRDNNPYLYTDPDIPYVLPISVLPYGGIYLSRDRKIQNKQYRLDANYTTKFNTNHLLTLYGAFEMASNDRDGEWFRGWGRQYSMGDVPVYAYEVFKQGAERGTDYFGTSLSRERTMAYSASGTYSYKGRYSLMGTARYDGSNRLGKARSSRWLPTWNFGGAWNAHEEEFFAALRPKLSHLKAYASYGLTADSPNATNAQAIYRARTAWRPEISAQEPSIYISGLENSELTYEKKYELNLGLETSFLNNRINLNLEHFRRRNFDLMGRIDVMGIGGVVSKSANVAAMNSRGTEITLTTRNIVTDDFRWTTSFVFSDIRLEITDLLNNQRVMDIVRVGGGVGLVGDPHMALYSVPFAGLTEDGFPSFYDENGTRTYNVYLQNRENIEFLKYEGSADPVTTGSLGNIFNYKNFRLNLYMTYSFGNKIRLDPKFSRSYTDFSSMPKDFKNRWVLPGDEAKTDIPVIPSTRQSNAIGDLRYAYNVYNYSDVRVADGGFIRMKEISLTYNVPKRIIASAHLTNLSLKLQATNLFLLYADSKLNGQDPEFINSGGVASPMAKQFTFTVSLGL